MAEALLTLGIAANVAQFIGLSLQLLSEGKKVYNSVHGAREEHLELETMMNNIEDLHQQVSKELQEMDDAGKKLVAGKFWKIKAEASTLGLIEKCAQIAKSLRQILDELKVPRDAHFRTLATVRQTFRYMGRKKEIEALKGRLLELDSQLRDRLLFVLQMSLHLFPLSNSVLDTNERLEKIVQILPTELQLWTRDMRLWVRLLVKSLVISAMIF